MKRSGFIGVFLVLCLVCAYPLDLQAQEQSRSRYNFNSDWLVKIGDPPHAQLANLNDSDWKPVTLPYAWNEDSAFKVSIDKLPTGVAWYRKHFRLPPEAEKQRIFIEFEGVRLAGDVYLNGEFLGRHENGVSAFGFDITSKVKPAQAENVLAVRTDNSWKYKEIATDTTFHWSDSNFYANYGGINRNVWLHVMAPVHQTLPLFSSLGTTGTYIWASDFDLATSSATIHAESQVRNDSATPRTIGFEAEVKDAEGTIVAIMAGPSVTLAPAETRTLSASVIAHHLHLWSWGYGYLYRVTTTLTSNGRPLDSVTTTTGFRQTAFEHGEVILNGRVLMVHGYGQRTTNEWPGVGIDLPPWLSDFSNRLMVEGNANVVRWMHVTPSPQDAASAARVGLIQSMPAGDSEGDSKGRQWEQRVELMRDSIIYNRNNPSILFYESGNKGISEEHMAEMKAVRDQYDPHGGRAAGAREMLNSKIAEYGGEMLYIDKSSTKPVWAHEYSRDESARAFWDADSPPFHADSPLYNRNQDSQAIEDVVRWDDYFRARPGTGTAVSDGGVKIIFSDSNTHHRGDNNYRRSGAVDAMRLPKDGFYADQVMWNGWVEPEKPAIHLVGHWNYPTGIVKPIYVVAADVARVELRLNGKLLGSVKASASNPNGSRALPAGAKPSPGVTGEPDIPAGQSNDFLFTFPDIKFERGTLEATGYDRTGHPVASTNLHTAGTPVALRLTPHIGPAGLRADGADLALVDVEAVDADGQRCPTANVPVSFTLTGPAEWRGGISQPPAGVSAATFDNYILDKTLPLENGINRVLLRANRLPIGSHTGTIKLEATSPDIKSASLSLNSTAVEIKDGLSNVDPATGLPSYLEHGPTPNGPPLHTIRTSIEVAGSTAGANPSQASLSVDGNDTTSWSNDGQISTAWIEYKLVGDAIPSQMDIKLNGFRTRRYPIRVTLDDQLLYEGTTPTSLGYVTVPFAALSQHPGAGTLRITLTAPPIDTGQTSGTAEITGKYDGAGVKPITHDDKALFNVIEVDFYR